ncbi:50S ribosomal protein L25/general stress protein Ctc [Aggregicoccus sp. 17bor-14]|uniref:50S ribosomal protein L25/general stress protein Ctc n=1 Tax=Myxococcaceae TaxID=31 RepID=UPI00129CC9CD|nr:MULTISPECIES: 50S ribosomal protein L25/general stress protein Ctc [Myxococcaceae]MBF5042633.1 50S ribosomal protein L25/general stress protein Ctc [Simulacricoccus sp. 17bor-14]MRI88401.1 50S ribosomal protein L25/general stress protein Ctc [Aggregicoccus sp. 17bor-14]
MATNTLEAKAREGAGKGAARRLRTAGLVPAVVYGKHLQAPLHIAVDPKAVRAAINTPHKFNTVITLKAQGGDKQVLLKEYQQDPVTREILHVDFIDVRENEQVKVKVPLVLVGKAIGTADGGLLTQIRREIEVFALPGSIPEKIEADVTHLKIATALHVNEMTMPKGVTVKSHVNYTIAVVSAPEKEEAGPAAAAAAAAAPAAGAAAPAAGAKPAAGAAAAPAAAKAPAKK